MSGENIIKIVRVDFFIMLKRIALFALLVLMPLLVFLLIINIYPALLTGQLSYPLIVLGISGYYIFIWLLLFFLFIDYYLDVSIVTSERIIDIEQDGFFSRIVAELRLYQVQDVTSEVKGFFPTLLNYGNVHIQTAGEVERFCFENVPNPEEVRDIIIKQSEHCKATHKDVIA
jgi:hypothetical protein